ncbi:major facilitator superfamily domain-containing protein [Chaetomium strumarium]|uniref:Major facilitator superfamily domain-containing protein n=1 Tax=Chaetomium strumarium TaxID=1170767 RepID=A0AAJ0GVW3_9PEZI|nr:major facilitator superfamily domain-containing protein [Chaetomium strumarium]
MKPRRSRGMATRELPPYPSRQLLILSLCRICEPIAFMSIFPYIYHMVKDFNFTDDESQISFYAGMVTSAFTFAEFSTSVFWGRLSDKVGRKPVLLMGMAGTGLSVLIFGFAPNLQVALLARALGGFLNGYALPVDAGTLGQADGRSNIAVLQTTVGELVTVKEHQPRAYAVMPLVWCIGSIVGPMIGGALAKPVESLPSVFAPGSIWDRFPYLLPNLFSAICVSVGVVIGVLFLEETHAEKKLCRDRGRELGNYLLSLLPGRSDKSKGKLPASDGEGQPLLMETESLPGYLTGKVSAGPSSASGSSQEELTDAEEAKPVTGIFTKPVLTIIASYGILAFHTMVFDSLLPVFLSTNPPEHRMPTSLPFKFADGFGLDARTIGVILSVQGIYSMLSTHFMFPLITERLGPLRLFKLMSVLYPLLYFSTPYIVLLPESLRMASVYILVVWKCTFSTLAYPSNAILITNSAPTTLTLGTINGAAASTASLCRALGPIVSGLLYSLGLESGYSILSWWTTGLVTIAGAYIGLSITEPRGRMDEKEDVEAAPESQSSWAGVRMDERQTDGERTCLQRT